MDKGKVLLALGIGAATLVGLCGLGLALLAFAARSFSVEPRWEQSAAAPAGAENLHGVRLPPHARNFYARESGFQDPMDELIFELDPAEVAGFLAFNHLSRGEAATAEAAEVLKLPNAPKATQLDGVENAESDAGFTQLYRHCELWEWPTRAFVYCDAWGT
jgi:hypothetical protein